MQIFVGIVGGISAIIGIRILVKPDTLKVIANFVCRGNRIYLLGAVRILLGFLFLLASSECKSTPIITMLGFLMIISGIAVLVIGKKRMHAMLAWWKSRTPAVIRIMGLIALAIGALIIYAA